MLYGMRVTLVYMLLVLIRGRLGNGSFLDVVGRARYAGLDVTLPNSGYLKQWAVSGFCRVCALRGFRFYVAQFGVPCSLFSMNEFSKTVASLG